MQYKFSKLNYLETLFEDIYRTWNKDPMHGLTLHHLCGPTRNCNTMRSFFSQIINITEVKEDDYGVYTCTVMNVIDSTPIQVELFPQSKFYSSVLQFCVVFLFFDTIV